LKPGGGPFGGAPECRSVDMLRSGIRRARVGMSEGRVYVCRPKRAEDKPSPGRDAEVLPANGFTMTALRAALDEALILRMGEGREATR
jgi:hypothetical protein